jgi:hypothetical protein
MSDYPDQDQNERKLHPLGAGIGKGPGYDWGNCPKCGWFYKQVTLPECPMCHHPWRIPAGYQQPPYEPPTL